jgi:RNA polymerase sigma-70 factor (ECF subfamily)
MNNAVTGPGTIESSEREAITRRMTRNSAEAEDLTQQTFLQVFRKIGTFRGESGFSTWLHRVTVNVVLMHLRRKKAAEIGFESLDWPGSDGESRREGDARDTSMLRAIERLNLMHAIRKLPSGYKRFFLLYNIGYERNEIALRLGCATGYSKLQLHKAPKRLRRLLQGQQRPPEIDVAVA